MALASPNVRLDQKVTDRPLTSSEAADWLGVHLNTLKRIPADELPYFRFGARGDRKYHEADVLAYIEMRMVR